MHELSFFGLFSTKLNLQCLLTVAICDISSWRGPRKTTVVVYAGASKCTCAQQQRSKQLQGLWRVSRLLILCSMHRTFRKNPYKKGSIETTTYNNYIHIILIYVFLCLCICLFSLFGWVCIGLACAVCVFVSPQREEARVYRAIAEQKIYVIRFSGRNATVRL